MNPNLPPGVRQSDLDGPQCPQCGQRGCDCDPDEDDGLTYRERVEERKAEAKEDR